MLRAEDGFLVGGGVREALTPNFTLAEFRQDDGSVRVHTELVTAVQLLRDFVGRAVHVHQVDSDGLGVLVSSTDAEALRGAAERLLARGLLESVVSNPDSLRLRVADPTSLAPVDLAQAIETAFSVTTAFETAGDAYQQVTGNFDKAGLSFGPAQVNFLMGTLPPLFEEFRQADEEALRSCFGSAAHYAEWNEVLAMSEPADQVQWANGISTGRGNHDVVQPWKGYLQAVGRVNTFRAIMVQSILRSHGPYALADVEYLQGLAPGVRIDHLRCLCALYDTAIQQGGVGKAKPQIERRVKEEAPTDQFHLVRIAVEERGKRALVEYQSDCLSRRLGILAAVPQSVEGTLRSNLQFYKLRDVKVVGLGVAPPDVIVSELERASQAIAEGATLLA